MFKNAEKKAKQAWRKVEKGAASIINGENAINREITKEFGGKPFKPQTLKQQVQQDVRREIAQKSSPQKSRRARNQSGMRSRGPRGELQSMGSNKVQSPAVIRKREYVMDILGTSTFNATRLPISVLNSQLFPWGSQILPNYEMYRIRRCRFFYNSLSSNYVTTGSLGEVDMAVIYDPDDPPINDMSTLAAYSGNKLKRVDKSYSVNLTTKNNPLPVRYVDHNSGANAFNDYGIFYIATKGCQSVTIGQLWVEYDLEVYIPRISSIPSYQSFACRATQGGGSVYFMDKNINGVSTYGNNYATITQGQGNPCVVNILTPGWYKVDLSFAVLAGTAISTFSSAYYTVTNCLCNTVVPTILAGSLFYGNGPLDNANSTQALATGGIFVDASSAFVQGNTNFGINIEVVCTGTTQYDCILSIQKIPYPGALTVPILPELNRFETMIRAQQRQIEMLQKNIITIVDDNCDNNNTATGLLDTPRWSRKIGLTENEMKSIDYVSKDVKSNVGKISSSNKK